MDTAAKLPAPSAARCAPAAIEDTGERFIPEFAGHDLMHAEHTARYRFACRLVAPRLVAQPPSAVRAAEGGRATGRRVLDMACGVGFGTRMMADSDPTT